MPTLPKHVLVNAGYDRYILFETSCDEKHVRMKAIKFPRSIMQELCLKGNGGMLDRGEYVHARNSSEGESFYTTNMEKQDNYMNIAGLGDSLGRVYRYTVEKPNLTLPKEFFQVYMGKDTECKWHVVLHMEQSVTVREVIKVKEIVTKITTLPKFVLKGFVDSLITSKETCPVTFEELAVGDVSLTGCFHAFQRSAMDHIMRTTKRCPTCRTELKADDVVLA